MAVLTIPIWEFRTKRSSLSLFTSCFLGSKYVCTCSTANALFKNTWKITSPFLHLPLTYPHAASSVMSLPICPCLMRPVKWPERKWKFGAKPRFSRQTNMLCVNIKALSTALSLSELYLKRSDPWQRE